MRKRFEPPWLRSDQEPKDGAIILVLLRTLLLPKVHLALENIALRQQIVVLKRCVPRARIRRRDRVFWVLLRQLWSQWEHALALVQPATVVRWHRRGWRLVWRLRSAAKPGRPAVSREVRDLIRRMSRENRLWGAPRIRDELALLGHRVAGEQHAQRLLDEFTGYYNADRPHRALDGTPPEPRAPPSSNSGPVVAIQHLGGLHHTYRRAA